jgi:hypothetical protein
MARMAKISQSVRLMSQVSDECLRYDIGVSHVQLASPVADGPGLSWASQKSLPGPWIAHGPR